MNISREARVQRQDPVESKAQEQVENLHCGGHVICPFQLGGKFSDNAFKPAVIAFPASIFHVKSCLWAWIRPAWAAWRRGNGQVQEATCWFYYKTNHGRLRNVPEIQLDEKCIHRKHHGIRTSTEPMICWREQRKDERLGERIQGRRKEKNQKRNSRNSKFQPK